MAVNVVFTEAKKGYNKEEVQRFIEHIMFDHERAIREKDYAIKSLMNEKEGLEVKYKSKIAELEETLADTQSKEKEQSAKYEELCARMGEKLLFAEQQSALIIAEAENLRTKAETEAAQKAELSVAAISAKARENAAAALRAADILKQKSQQICVGLDHTKRVLEEALEAIEKTAKNA